MGYKIKEVEWKQKTLRAHRLEKSPGRQLWQPKYNPFNIRITRAKENAPYILQAPGFSTTQFDNITDAMVFGENIHARIIASLIVPEAS